MHIKRDTIGSIGRAHRPHNQENPPYHEEHYIYGCELGRNNASTNIEANKKLDSRIPLEEKEIR